MLDNINHNNSTCSFGEQIVSYLYGESSVKEKAMVETHLNSCAVCAEDFAGFGMARSSILEWRNEEFLSLETPLIEIPYEKQRDFYNAKAGSNVLRDWIAALRRVFAVSPAFASSATVAIVAICLGIIFFANKSSNNVEIVGVDGRNTEQFTSLPKASNKDFSVEQTKADSGKTTDTVSADKATKSLISIAENNNRNKIKNSSIARKDWNVKISDVSRNSVKSKNPKVTLSKINLASNENKKPMFAQTGKIPTLNNVEEDEDKSLRLAELFDDGDAE
jgi:hypothetical protein